MKRAGLLNEVIQIKRLTSVVNDFGEKVETWENHLTTRARVMNDSGNRNLINDEIFYSYNKTFQVRYYIDVVETDIVVWQNKEYRIISVEKRRFENDILIRTQLINE